MSCFDTVVILLLLTASAGFVDYRWLHMPNAIGLLVVAPLLSPGIALAGHIAAAGLRSDIAQMLTAANLPHLLFDSVLSSVVLTSGGLRGALSEAMALSLPGGPDRAALLQVCYAVVIFTIVVQGLTTPRLVRRLYGSAVKVPEPYHGAARDRRDPGRRRDAQGHDGLPARSRRHGTVTPQANPSR